MSGYDYLAHFLYGERWTFGKRSWGVRRTLESPLDIYPSISYRKSKDVHFSIERSQGMVVKVTDLA